MKVRRFEWLCYRAEGGAPSRRIIFSVDKRRLVIENLYVSIDEAWTHDAYDGPVYPEAKEARAAAEVSDALGQRMKDTEISIARKDKSIWGEMSDSRQKVWVDMLEQAVACDAKKKGSWSEFSVVRQKFTEREKAVLQKIRLRRLAEAM